MDHTYWQKQSEKPLFPELEWNKPERRDQAGRLLIIGGYQHNLNAPAKAYEYVKQAGIGSIQVVLPSKVKPLVGSTLLGAVFLPSTSSGELARNGFEELISHANWADTIVMPGDLGRNSQTTLLIADLISHTTNQIVLSKDAIDALKNTPEIMYNRESTTLILSFAQLQEHAKRLGWNKPFVFNMGLVQLVEQLHELSSRYQANLVTLHQNSFIVAVNGQVSTTPTNTNEDKQWRVKAASLAACYQTWNHSKQFESLTHSTFLLK